MNEEDYNKNLKFIRYLMEFKPIKSKNQEIELNIKEICDSLQLSYDEVNQFVEILALYHSYFKPFFVNNKMDKSESQESNKNHKFESKSPTVTKSDEGGSDYFSKGNFNIDGSLLAKLADYDYLMKEKVLSIQKVESNFPDIHNLLESVPILFSVENKNVKLSKIAKELTDEFRRFKKLNKKCTKYQFGQYNFNIN